MEEYTKQHHLHGPFIRSTFGSTVRALPFSARTKESFGIVGIKRILGGNGTFFDSLKGKNTDSLNHFVFESESGELYEKYESPQETSVWRVNPRDYNSLSSDYHFYKNCLNEMEKPSNSLIFKNMNPPYEEIKYANNQKN